MNPARVRLPGHPDAACDLVAEAIVDEFTRRDSASKIALSVTGGRGALFVAGDVVSKADFDVSQLVGRTFGALGITAPMEPFVSLEPVVGERAAHFGTGAESPVTVTGYATDETPELVPAALSLARSIAMALEEKRTADERWFWLGPDAEVFVGDGISIRVEHGSKSIEDVRREIAELVRGINSNQTVRVNELGAEDARGLAHVMGASGRVIHPYGAALPANPSGIGLDVSRPEKSGAWLLRAAARNLVSRGAKAALVRATYLPGEREPISIAARDEKGKDVSNAIDRASLHLDRVASEWWRPNLNADAARWGIAGAAGLPWEL